MEKVAMALLAAFQNADIIQIKEGLNEEVIREHKELEAEDKKQNRIVNIDLPN
ncbi:MAG TPA: hypothetical protein VH500_11090 [Nitrososphaeraceae archaeon]|jgi:hypothetical protein